MSFQIKNHLASVIEDNDFYEFLAIKLLRERVHYDKSKGHTIQLYGLKISDFSFKVRNIFHPRIISYLLSFNISGIAYKIKAESRKDFREVYIPEIRLQVSFSIVFDEEEKTLSYKDIDYFSAENPSGVEGSWRTFGRYGRQKKAIKPLKIDRKAALTDNDAEKRVVAKKLTSADMLYEFVFTREHTIKKKEDWVAFNARILEEIKTNFPVMKIVVPEKQNNRYATRAAANFVLQNEGKIISEIRCYTFKGLLSIKFDGYLSDTKAHNLYLSMFEPKHEIQNAVRKFYKTLITPSVAKEEEE